MLRLQLRPVPPLRPPLRILLRPLPEHLALNLSARRLGHFLYEDDAPGELLMLGHAFTYPFLDAPLGGGVLVLGFERDVGAGKLFLLTDFGISMDLS